MRGSKRPTDERAKAVGIALVQGVPAAAKATGIPMRTIRDYKNSEEFAELRLSAKEQVADVMWVGIQIGLEEVFNGLRSPDARLRDKADALFGLLEHHALLTGQATTRTETRDITGSFDDHELDAIKRILHPEPEAEVPVERP